MWTSMIDRTITDDKLPREDCTVKDVFRGIMDEMPSLKLSQNKINIVSGLVVDIPATARDEFTSHMQSRMWHRCGLNNEILACKEFQLNYCPSGVVGVWSSHLRNQRPETCAAVAKLALLHFTNSLGAKEHTCKTRELQSARPKLNDIEKIQLCCALFDNWLLPLINATEPRILKETMLKFTTGKLVDELSRIANGRESAELGNNLALHVVPSIAVLMHSLADSPGVCTGNVDEAKVFDCYSICEFPSLCAICGFNWIQFVRSFDSLGSAKRIQFIHWVPTPL